jgi:hypothetical protein
LKLTSKAREDGGGCIITSFFSVLNIMGAIGSGFKGGTCSTNGRVVLILNFRQDLKYCIRKSLFVPTILRNMLTRVQSFLVPEHVVPIITTVRKRVN